MLTKALLAIILATCGVPSTPATTEPPAEQPDAPPSGSVKPMDESATVLCDQLNDDRKYQPEEVAVSCDGSPSCRSTNASRR